MKRKIKNAKRALDALNTLALLLTDYHHHWSKKEKLLYNGAYRWLTSFCDEDLGA